MQCSIYRSEKKMDTYLYIIEENNLNQLPEGLDKLLGRLEFVMELDLEKIKRLENADLDEVKQRLTEAGFYLQLPRDLHISV
ncbi:MAG: YcgL domain-containing protein [Gammaproteobacteria bacterium]|nr:YcgL domain-containing protein [Gammaproteobacteria bacterium]